MFRQGPDFHSRKAVIPDKRGRDTKSQIKTADEEAKQMAQLQSEHKKITNRTTVGPTIDIDSQVLTF